MDYDFNKLEIATLIKALTLVKNDIIKLSQAGIVIYDISNVNIIFHNDCQFKIIDTNCYTFSKDDVLEDNMFKFNYYLLQTIFNDDFSTFVNNYYFEKWINSYYNPEEILSCLNNKLEKIISNPKVKDIKTLSKKL